MKAAALLDADAGVLPGSWLGGPLDAATEGWGGATTRVWARTGSRPTAVKQARYEWVYLYAAIEPKTGASVALQARLVNTGTMNVFLRMLGEEIKAGEHGLLNMDRAGWHKSRALSVPANITVPYPPPYSPEFNPVERLWAYLRSHYLSNRTFDGYQHLLDGGADAWQRLTPDVLKSVCACPYLTHEE